MRRCSSIRLRIASSLNGFDHSSPSLLHRIQVHSAGLPALPLSVRASPRRSEACYLPFASYSTSSAAYAKKARGVDDEDTQAQDNATIAVGQTSSSVASSVQHHQPGSNYLTSLCDEAIHFSRDVTFSDNLSILRQKLADAVVVLRQLLDTHQKYGGKGKDLSYEIGIVRAAFLQVVRTLRALNGKETALLQAQILGDHLEWEASLIKSGISELVDEDVARFTLRTHEDIAYTPATDLVRTFLLLHDITDDLTFPTEDRNRSRRGFPSGEAREAMIHLWTSAKSIPLWAWHLPIPEADAETEVDDGIEAMEYLMKQHFKALLEGRRFADAVFVWEDSVALFGPSSKRSLALSNLMGNHLRAYRKLTHSLQRTGYSRMPDGNSLLDCLYDYARGLRRLALLLEAGGMQVGVSDMNSNSNEVVDRSMKPLLKTRNTIIRSIALMDVLRGRLDSAVEGNLRGEVPPSLRTEVVNGCLEAKGASESLRRWISTWPSDASRAIHLTVNTYNALLAMLLHRQAHPAPSAPLAMSLLKRMTRYGPAPDASTINVLLHHANELRDKPLLNAVIRLAMEETKSLKAELNQVEGDEDDKAEISALSQERTHENKHDVIALESNPWLWLIEGGLLSNDAYRLTAVLKIIVTHGLYQKLYIGGRRVAVLNTGISPARIIYTLYPSLDLRRRSALSRKTKITNARFQDGRSLAAFDPYTLAMALHLLALSRKSGMAERVWKLMKRASRRSKGKRSMDRGWDIPMQAYTSMMKVWAAEARYSRRERGQRHTSSVYSASIASVESGSIDGDLVAQRQTERGRQFLDRHHQRLRASSSSMSKRGSTIPLSALYVRGWFDENTHRSERRRHATPVLRAHAAVIRALEAYLELRERWYESILNHDPDPSGWQSSVDAAEVGNGNATRASSQQSTGPTEVEEEDVTFDEREDSEEGIGHRSIEHAKDDERPDALFMRTVVKLLERSGDEGGREAQELAQLVREDVRFFGLDKQVRLARLPRIVVEREGEETGDEVEDYHRTLTHMPVSEQ